MKSKLYQDREIVALAREVEEALGRAGRPGAITDNYENLPADDEQDDGGPGDDLQMDREDDEGGPERAVASLLLHGVYREKSDAENRAALAAEFRRYADVFDAAARALGDEGGDDSTPRFEWAIPLRPIGPDEDPRARLLGSVNVFGRRHHFEAEAVTRNAEGDVEADAPESNFDDVLAIVGGQPETANIRGREYVLFMTPYAE